MRSYLRNLLAALRGRRGQAAVASIVESFQTGITTLVQAQSDITGELVSSHRQLDEIISRQNVLYDDLYRAKRLTTKLREFTK